MAQTVIAAPGPAAPETLAAAPESRRAAHGSDWWLGWREA